MPIAEYFPERIKPRVIIRLNSLLSAWSATIKSYYVQISASLSVLLADTTQQRVGEDHAAHASERIVAIETAWEKRERRRLWPISDGVAAVGGRGRVAGAGLAHVPHIVRVGQLVGVSELDTDSRIKELPGIRTRSSQLIP